jgi:3-phosphoshikimate 1-carboxyvinyltransferase
MILVPSRLNGVVRVPSSKSIGHRMLICAALSDGVSKLYNLSLSKDIEATIIALTQLGASFAQTYDDEGIEFWKVDGLKKKQFDKYTSVKEMDSECSKINSNLLYKKIECNESGSTLRFLIPVSLAITDSVAFYGNGSLVVRPIDEYFPIFEQNKIHKTYNGELPLYLKGQLKSGEYQLSGSVSSQYTTGMLLAAPLLEGSTEISIIGEMESKAYIDLTIESMNLFGVAVERQGWEKFKINQNQYYKPATVSVEGDFSQAAFWIVAGVIGSEKITINGLNANSAQGDKVVIDLVLKMGGSLKWEGKSLMVEPSRTTGIIIDASQCPDLIPVMCVLASLSEGETKVINGKRLRLKESDRIKTTVCELKKLGANIVETLDGMLIQGQQSLEGGCVINGSNDHRIVMAMAIASTRCKQSIEIEGHEAIDKSYPTFFQDFIRMGGNAIM